MACSIVFTSPHRRCAIKNISSFKSASPRFSAAAASFFSIFIEFYARIETPALFYGSVCVLNFFLSHSLVFNILCMQFLDKMKKFTFMAVSEKEKSREKLIILL
jgi:hypothetical protein